VRRHCCKETQPERVDKLVEVDVSRSDEVVSYWIVAATSFDLRWIDKKNTRDNARPSNSS
jgi:hypothetical protein